MATVSKPATGAFVLDNNKAKLFLSKKNPRSIDAINRFENRKTKSAITSTKN